MIVSRAFVKDDADNERIMVPQRAPLPEGTTNFVTPSGHAALVRERDEIVEERLRLQGEPGESSERARRLTVLRGRLDDLEARIASARVVEAPPRRTEEVRFGSTVQVRTSAGEEIRFSIVGVDEADPLDGRVAFTAPTAAALLGHEVGDRVSVEVAGSVRELEILNVGDDEARYGR